MRDEFEKTASFALRTKTYEARVRNVLSQPMLLPAYRGMSDREGASFEYDADREVIHVTLNGARRIPPYRELALLVWPRTFADASCDFPLGVDDARARMKNLGALYSVRGEQPAAAFVIDKTENVSGAVFLLVRPPDDIEVWLVDLVRRERLGAVPLTHCGIPTGD